MENFKAVIPGDLGTKVTYTHRNNINLQQYKFTGVQKLQETDYVVRIWFCSWFCETVCIGEVKILSLILQMRHGFT